MSAITVNGTRVASASITIPHYGAWTANVDMPSGSTIASPVTIVAGDLTLVGTVVRQASFNGDTSARIVGGGGGWRNELPAKGYSHIVGVKMSTVLQDAASECGESIEIDDDILIGSHWARCRGTGEQMLRLLASDEWWVDSDGITQISPRPSSEVVAPFTVIVRSPSQASFTIATEHYASWLPANTFRSNTVTDVQTISSVTIQAENNGKTRLTVLSSDTATDRLRSDIRRIIQSEIARAEYSKVWSYTIAPNPINLGVVSTIDCNPVEASMPPLTRVPLVGTGVVSPPLAGTSCRIRFADGDPSKPECIGLGGTTEHLVTIESLVVILHNTIIGLAALATPPAWLGSGITPGIINVALAASGVPAPPGVIAQVAAAASQASSMANGPGATSSLYTAAIAAALTGKTLNVSGLFPSVGVPNQ